MTGALQVLHSVIPRLLQHAGDGDSAAAAAGWLVGLVVEGRALVTSSLRSKINFDKSLQLQQDIGTAFKTELRLLHPRCI
jgi:hypothetical protein